MSADTDLQDPADPVPTGRPDAASSRRGGPPLPLPALAYGALTVAGAATYPGPLPTATPTEVLATLLAHPVAAQVSAVLLLGASAPLAVWTAAAVHRLQRLGVRVAGPMIGLVGGVLAAASLLVSGLVAWTAAGVAPLGNPALSTALSTLSFAFGGVGFAVCSALLIAGVAVPVLIRRLVPRGLAIAGIVVAVLGVASLASLLVPALAVLLPATRFGGLLWLVAVSVVLPVSRPHRAPTPQ